MIACEPDEASVKQLRQNLAMNGLEAKVDVQPHFVGSPGGVSLDALAHGQEGPFAIKIDVDGAELDVSRSGAGLLSRESCHLVVETHSAELERSCLGYLEALGYRTRIIPNGWYRRFVPEQRPIAHNRWFTASKP